MGKQQKQTDAPLEAAAEWVDIDALKPWPGNPRKNDGEPVRRVAESIKRFGFAAPIVARKADGEIIAGHTRWKAAQSLRLKRVPVRFVDLDPADAHLLALADNRYTELTEWDKPALGAALSEFGLEDAAFAGWDSDGLSKLGDDFVGNVEPVVEEDDVPEPPKVAVTKFGDVWALGRHRLVCGDSRIDGIVIACAGDVPDMLLTDPPYGVSYVGKTADALPVHNDGADTIEPLLRESLRSAVEAIQPGAAVYVWAPAGPTNYLFGHILRELDVWRQVIIWVKDQFVLGHSDFHYQHEPIFYGWKPGAPHREPPDRKQTSVWEFARPKASREHPTMKPVQMFVHAISLSSSRGNLVLDPFLGSGTSLIAAEQTERQCVGVEFSPQYCDVIVERWQNLTGGKAERRSAA